MATKTPAERAIADVEKAIKDADKAHEKYEAAAAKADEAMSVAKSADRELRWRANHPNLPEDFDLDEFRRSLEAPFEDDVDPVLPDEGEVAEAEAELADANPEEDADNSPMPETSPRVFFVSNAAEIDEAAPEDDPWASEA